MNFSYRQIHYCLNNTPLSFQWMKGRKVKCYTLENSNGKITELVMIAWQWEGLWY